MVGPRAAVTDRRYSYIFPSRSFSSRKGQDDVLPATVAFHE